MLTNNGNITSKTNSKIQLYNSCHKNGVPCSKLIKSKLFVKAKTDLFKLF